MLPDLCPNLIRTDKPTTVSDAPETSFENVTESTEYAMSEELKADFEFMQYNMIPVFNDAKGQTAPDLLVFNTQFTLLSPTDEEIKSLTESLSHPLCCYVKLHRKDNGYSIPQTVIQLQMLQNDVYNAGGANTVSSADQNENHVDEFVSTIVKKLSQEVTDSAKKRALKDKAFAGLRLVRFKNNDRDLLCDVIKKMDNIQCGLWDYHDEKTQERLFEVGIRHPSIRQPQIGPQSEKRSPARRKLNSQPESFIDLT